MSARCKQEALSVVNVIHSACQAEGSPRPQWPSAGPWSVPENLASHVSSRGDSGALRRVLMGCSHGLNWKDTAGESPSGTGGEDGWCSDSGGTNIARKGWGQRWRSGAPNPARRPSSPGMMAVGVSWAPLRPAFWVTSSLQAAAEIRGALIPLE